MTCYREQQNSLYPARIGKCDRVRAYTM